MSLKNPGSMAASVMTEPPARYRRFSGSNSRRRSPSITSNRPVLRPVVGASGGIGDALEVERHAAVFGHLARGQPDILFDREFVGQRHAQEAHGKPGMGEGHAAIGERNSSGPGQEAAPARLPPGSAEAPVHRSPGSALAPNRPGQPQPARDVQCRGPPRIQIARATAARSGHPGKASSSASNGASIAQMRERPRRTRRAGA